jgi:hypothetical protein
MASGAPRTSASPGYEARDVWPGGVLLVALALVATLVLVALGAWAAIAWFDHRLAGTRPAATALEQTDLVPPEPRLQTERNGDAAVINGRAEAVLRSYGWVDKDEGVARIPVAEAMRLLAEHGWPTERRAKP